MLSSMSVPEIRQRLESNLTRVQTLVSAGEGPGKSDMLRAAVVFLHATLEDVIRSGLELELPRAGAPELGRIPFVLVDDSGETRKSEKISLAELTQYRGKMVDDMIKDLVDEYLNRSNFNNIEEIGAALKRMGLGTLGSMGLDSYADDIMALTSRRHWIVHRVDRNPSAGARGMPKARRIHAATVNAWMECVSAVATGILDALERKP